MRKLGTALIAAAFFAGCGDGGDTKSITDSGPASLTLRSEGGLTGSSPTRIASARKLAHLAPLIAAAHLEDLEDTHAGCCDIPTFTIKYSGETVSRGAETMTPAFSKLVTEITALSTPDRASRRTP